MHMKVKTQVKAGGLKSNHNQTLVRDRSRATAGSHPQGQRQALKVKTQVKAGGLKSNHNQTLVRDRARRR
jgi:hypothetical protein